MIPHFKFDIQKKRTSLNNNQFNCIDFIFISKYDRHPNARQARVKLMDDVISLELFFQIQKNKLSKLFISSLES